MSALPLRREFVRLGGSAPPARIALLGTGNVGQAVLRRLANWAGEEFGDRLVLVHAANSRAALSDPAGLDPSDAATVLRQAQPSQRLADAGRVAEALGDSGVRILIDATADEGVARSHADLLAAGIHVATACKLATGTSLDRWNAIHRACGKAGSGFGDRATVGAGLPLIRSLAELRRGGDRIHAIAGVMSGSLAWLFDQFDGSRPFSDHVRRAHELGFTEPDPREDLSGEDVRRKILILARTAGFALEQEDVDVRSLVPPELAALDPAEVAGNLHLLDPQMEVLAARAREEDRVLRFVARFEEGAARVGVEALKRDDPLAAGRGADNKVIIRSDRYLDRPLVIQGPGAGAEVTAAALLDDVLELYERAILSEGKARGEAAPPLVTPTGIEPVFQP